MATGATGIASQRRALPFLAMLLLAAAATSYGVLLLLTVVRLLRFPRALVRDMQDHARGPGFFTMVAGTCILGSLLLLRTGAEGVAWGLWGFALLLWVLVMYGFFVAVSVRRQKPSLTRGINGAWLLASVSTQSVAILTLLLPFALSMHLIGCMLYLAIIPLIFYRLTFLPLSMDALSPPYWINMGAVAIATLAGATLLLEGDPALISRFGSFLTGFTVFFWAVASWWIPFLIGLTLWRHAVARHPLAYDPSLWGMVFPLAMYTTATLRLAEALSLPALEALAAGFYWLALLAWTATSVAMLRELARTARTPEGQTSLDREARS